MYKSTLLDYELTVTPQESREVARVVGYLEYGQALRRFDSLVKMASAEELKAFDEIVRERDELAVFTNLSRRIPRPATSLDEIPQQAGDNFERRGLAWIMALARVEIGAMLAGFTDVRNPFEAVGVTPLDRGAYEEMLQDGMRTHFWALMNDPGFSQVAKVFKPNQQSLAYIRRLVIARAFLKAALKIAAPRYTPIQLAELMEWKERLDGRQTLLVANFHAFMQAQQAQRVRNQLLSDCNAACNRLLSLTDN